MSVLICGSLAFDTITNFHGRFAQQIMPDKVHMLNVSFLVPTLRREYGGCAGNIAYTLHLLGGEPLVKGAIGNDGGDYMARLKGWGVDTSLVLQAQETYTAQCMIITDEDNNQITAFHPGAMMLAHTTPVPVERKDITLAIVAPDGREAMLGHCQQLADAKIPFIFDPGQNLPLFSGPELQRFTEQATWVAVNDYEGAMLTERIGTTIEALSRQPNLKGVIVTLGAEGCEVWINGSRTHVPGVAAEAVVDPTGCGDAFRAALLHGLSQGWSLARCVALGNQIGALKIAQRGGQNHTVPPALLAAA
ncbi:carbohydrate kinase family protein [Aquabacterium sp. OR-4]|uniref:carbohydrate kinase family protein n=1 Tax=Aquabacterium sp. OR-4 TaxID=2978127 RepID=UPI0021B2F6A2|nr:carbohydrate kinase family protein [Aquabacterium sp. OR-4]MDT7834389.1 carbohydrate kinase family protein [Aquabacterium sp. OR-4]